MSENDNETQNNKLGEDENTINDDDNDTPDNDNSNDTIKDATNIAFGTETLPIDEIMVQLGDVIVIKSPGDYILHDKIFYVEYIDKEKIKIINVDDFSVNTILLNIDGTITDKNIKSITIISSNPKKGYARQNNLLPNTWVDIYFDSDIPLIITGKITNLEDDMIEIKTINNDVIYINFNYQGIPENLPPLSFEIRDKPTSLSLKKDTTMPEDISALDKVEKKDKPVEQKRANFKTDRYGNIILDDNDFTIGDIVQIQEVLDIDDSMKRYNIDEQTNDFFENLLSTIPNNKRNSTIINEFNIIVKRFVELRQMSSIFDKYGNVEGHIIHDAKDIPLANYLSQFQNKLYWIKYGVINNREIFDGDEAKTFSNVSAMIYLLKSYSKNNNNNEQNNYYKLFNSLDKYIKPFNVIDQNDMKNVFSKPEGLIITKPVTGEVNTIDNTLPNVVSQVYVNTKTGINRFVTQQFSTGLDWLVAPLPKGGRMVGKREMLTPNDTINVNAIFTLPEPVVRFSQINLPNSNLLVKANLNQAFINYSQLLKRITPTKNIILNDLENAPDIVGNPDEYLNDEIKKFTLNLTSFDENTDITDMAIFHQFIKLIVPSNTSLFKLINKYIDGTLSVQNAILYLEPFMIYSNDLTFTQYKTISEFVRGKIREYNDMFSKYEEIFNTIRTKTSYSTTNIFTSNLYNLLNDLKSENVGTKGYKITNSKTDKGSEKQSIWIEGMSTKHHLPFWTNTQTNESVWEKPAELIQEEEEKRMEEEERKRMEEEKPEIEINFFNQDIKSKLIQMYNLSNTNISSSEFIKMLLSKDYGTLFSSLISYTNLKLMIPNKLNKLFEEEKEILKQIINDDRAKNTCKTYVIAKKYYSFDKLKADDDINIYFDREYDHTNYDIIEEKFKKEQGSMTKEEFRIFLIPQLKKLYNLSDENANYMSETLTDGLKKVLNGHYALLSVLRNGEQTMTFYLRENDKWIESNEGLNESSFVKDDDILCNINYDCLYDTSEKTEGKCLSNDVNENNIIEKQFKGILDQFDKNYEYSMDELTEMIKNKILFNEKKFYVLNNYNTNEFLKYNNDAYKLGKSLDKNSINTIVSPYANLRDLILGQNDYSKKQQTIIIFVDKYCRRGIASNINPITKELETEWLFYCRETNVPLIPYFRYELAKIFTENPNEYENTLQKLIKEIGKQSDDGDSWVDQHSGEVICKIDLDFSEGYKDGFVNKSRDIIAQDANEMVVQNLTNKQLELSFKSDSNTIFLNDVISVLEGALGIKLAQNKEFILKIGTSLLRHKSSDNAGILLTRNEYIEESKKTTKKVPSYELYYSIKIMYLALGLFAIGVQTSIPSIKTRKVAPRCTKSFQGYPLGQQSDDTFIKYIACAIKPYRGDTIPWMAIEKDDSRMVPMIIKYLDDYLLSNIEINQKKLKKIEYLNTSETKLIPDEYSVVRWSSFLPPLVKFNIKSDNKAPVSNDFFKQFKQDISTSSNPLKQEEKINVINSKIIYQSLSIQEEIQKIVDKKELIMKSSSSYYMINSCCNNITDNITTLEYFISDSPIIKNYNNYVDILSGYLEYINYLSKAPIRISSVNTKYSFPEIPNSFDEETIYRGFITYCKFNTLGGLSKDLLDVCLEKPKYDGRGRSIQEQIFQLKKMGKEYRIDDFLKLYKVVCKNNLVTIKNNNQISPIEKLNDYIEKLEKKQHLYGLSREIIDNYSLLVDTSNYFKLYENDTNEMTSMKNSLEMENDKMIKDIYNFISSNTNVGTKQLSLLKKFIENLRFYKWEFINTSRNIPTNISNDKLYNYIRYISNFIELFSRTYPEMIMHNQINSITPHKYWKLSENHNKMIVKFVDEYYYSFDKFYKNEELLALLSYINPSSKYIVELSKLTPSMTNIQKDVLLKHTFDEELSSLLYEYYLLCLFKLYMTISENEITYIHSNNEEMVSDPSINKKNVAELLVVYLNTMMDSKRKINITYESINEAVFKNRELEKNLFTERLATMTQEERDIDTTLKGLKLGMYGLGQTKALRFYDQDQFEEDKKLNESIAKLEKKANRPMMDDVEIDDDQYESTADADEAEELMMNTNEDYEDGDGDPYGDEYE